MRILRRLLLALASFLLACGLAEGIQRLWLRAHGRPYSAAATRERLLTLRNALSQRLPLPGTQQREEPSEARDQIEVVHPYLSWESLARLDRVAVESAAFRRGDGRDSFDVLVLGGSVAEIVMQLGGERLKAVLEADPRLGPGSVRLLNHGRAAHKQPQQVLALIYLLGLGYAPDAVINLDGFNEVAVGNGNAVQGVHPLYPMSSQWRSLTQGSRTDPEALDLLLEMRVAQKEALAIGARALALSLHKSSLLGSLAYARMNAARARAGAAFQEYMRFLAARADDVDVRGPSFRAPGEELDAVADLLVPHWAASSRQMHALCSEQGLHAGRKLRYLHVLQPTLHDDGAKPLTPEELASAGAEPSWIEGVRRGYPLLRAAGAALAAEGVPFLDASRVFADVEETLYYDACHFGRAGCELLAEEIGRALLAEL